jgi:hypothetical protein
MKKIILVLIVAFFFSFGSVLAEDWTDKDKIYWMVKCVSLDRSFDVCHCVMVKILKKKETGNPSDDDVRNYLSTCLDNEEKTKI